MTPPSRPSGPPPTPASLREAALAHLARYATTRAGLVRVLDRKVARWLRAAGQQGEEAAAEQAAAARLHVRGVIEQLAELGLVNDAAFAESRARSLVRAGRSRRAVAAHLAARGVVGETVQAALPDDPTAELAAAVALTRRRRIGAFRADAADVTDPARLLRERGMLARAGFSQDVAAQALALAPDAAEAILLRLRQG